MRLIDADKLRKHERSVNDGNTTWLMNVYLPEEIDNAPTIQAVPIEILGKMKSDINGIRYSHMFNYVSRERILDTVIEIIDKYTKGEGE